MNKRIFTLLFASIYIVCHGQNVGILISEAAEKLESNHWEQAYDGFKSILSQHSSDLTYLQQAEIYNHLGYLSLVFLDPEEAERDLNRSLTYHEQAGIPDQYSYAQTLLNMGMLYLEQVEFDLARDYVKRALVILNKKPEWTIDYLVARAKLARIYEEAGSYILALSIYNESYDKLILMGNDLSPDFAEICSHKGRILILTGNPTEGEKFINLSTTIYESLGPTYNVPRAESMEDLALFYEQMGRYDEAEKMLLEILDLKRSIPDEADILIIETLNDLGVMYNRLKRYAKAEKMFREVVSECEENVGKDHHFYATAKNNLGTIALNQGDYKRAKVLLEEALERFSARFGSFHPYYADVLNNLARTERKLSNYTAAEDYYQEVLQIDQKLYGNQHPNYATTMLNIGILLSSDGRENEAEQYYDTALLIREKALGHNHPAYGSALEYTGIHYLAVGKMEIAEEKFRKSIAIQINQIRALFPIMTPRERELIYLQIQEDVSRYNYVASHLLDQNPNLVKHIFDFQAKTKTLLFNSLDKVHDLVMSSKDEVLKTEYQNWLSDKQLLASYYQMGTDQLLELHINLSSVESAIASQENNLRKKLVAFEEALPHEKLGWQYVFDLIEPDEAIVEMVKIKEFAPLSNDSDNIFGFSGKCRYLAIIFLGDSAEPQFTFLGSASIDDTDHYTSCQNSVQREKQDESAFKSYWKPIMNMTKKAKSLLVIPDGFFYKINPNLFKVNKREYVFDKQYVRYLTSTHDLFKPEAQILRNKLSLVYDPAFGNIEGLDLSSVENEPAIELNVTNADWNINRYTGSDATEYKVRSLYQSTVLHIATPIVFNTEKPLANQSTQIMSPVFNSGLLLSGFLGASERSSAGIPEISENNGILTVDEVMKLDLDRTRLVILCLVMANGENLENGEKLYGLMRAFSVAGARNVIASTKPINQNIKKEFLEIFYDKFFETNEIQSSFQYAQLEIKNKYEETDSWGAFIFAGNHY